MLTIQIKYLVADEETGLAMEPKIPQRQTPGSAGYDLFAAQEVMLEPTEAKLIPLGFAMALPNGYEAQIRPRSGLALKHQIAVLNSPGTIDSDHREQVQVLLINFGKSKFVVEKHMRIAQMVIAKIETSQFVEVQNLQKTARGEGWGSTGV